MRDVLHPPLAPCKNFPKGEAFVPLRRILRVVRNISRLSSPSSPLSPSSVLLLCCLLLRRLRLSSSSSFFGQKYVPETNSSPSRDSDSFFFSSKPWSNNLTYSSKNRSISSNATTSSESPLLGRKKFSVTCTESSKEERFISLFLRSLFARRNGEKFGRFKTPHS